MTWKAWRLSCSPCHLSMQLQDRGLVHIVWIEHVRLLLLVHETREHCKNGAIISLHSISLLYDGSLKPLFPVLGAINHSIPTSFLQACSRVILWFEMHPQKFYDTLLKVNSPSLEFSDLLIINRGKKSKSDRVQHQRLSKRRHGGFLLAFSLGSLSLKDSGFHIDYREAHVVKPENSSQ